MEREDLFEDKLALQSLASRKFHSVCLEIDSFFLKTTYYSRFII